MNVRYSTLFILTAALTGCAIDADSGAAARASSATGDTTVIITDDDVTRQAENTPPTDSWVLYTRTPASVGTFQVGPGTPPSGVGSLGLSTPTGADKLTLFNYDYVGTPLASISALGYSTYRTAGNLQQVTSINLQVDFNGAAPGGFTTLVFEPVYNTAQGPVTSGAWQTWDAIAGGDAVWWSTRAIPGVCPFDCFVSWSAILAANPDAVILGGVGVNQGSGNADLSAAVDALIVGVGGTSTTFDFEPYRVATSRNTCMNGGWRSLRRADGSSFRNQGDCVSYVSNGR